MSEAVVHCLEVGEVHHEHRDRLAGAWLAQQLLLQALDEQRAIRQARKQIVEELVFTLFAQLEQLAYRAGHDERGHEVHRHRERDALRLDAVGVGGLPPADDGQIRGHDDAGRGQGAKASEAER